MLRGELAAALDGGMRTACLLGEAGIGKTRIATALAEEAAARGAAVAWGRSHGSGGAPVYRPWLQLLAGLARGLRGARGKALDDASAALQRDASALTGDQSSAWARFAVFDRVVQALGEAAAERPLALVLDDLHWADLGSLRLLEFVAREVVAAPLLLLGAVRDGEPHAGDERAAVLSAVLGRSRSVQLRGLRDDAVAALLEDRLEDPPDTALVDRVRTATGGNPFLVIEMANLLATSDGNAPPADVPAGARELLRERLSVLDAGEVRALEAASVIGVEFDPALLATVLDVSELELRRRLESIAERGLLREVEQAPRRLGFTHALLREALYGALSAEARCAWHARAARAIEALEGDPEVRVPLLAHHHFLAAQSGDLGGAANACAAAGELALERLAFEEATRQFERALSLPGGGGDVPRWQLLAGHAQGLHGCGEHDRARDVFRQSVASASEVGPEAFAVAVLRFASADAETMVPDAGMNQRLEEALDGLPPDAPHLRAFLLARLAWGLHLLPGADERRRKLSEEALALARSLGDARTLEIVLGTRLIGLDGPDHFEERRAILDEFPARPSTPSAELNALAVRVGDLAERGDRAAYDAAVGTFEQKARALRQPFFLWAATNFRAATAILEGRFEKAEALAREALAVGSRVLSHSPALQFALQAFVLLGWQGRFAEMEPALTSGFATSRVVPGWRSALAYFYCFTDREAEARREFETLAAEDFADIPRDGAWSMSVNLLGRTCAHLADAPRARILYELLAPCAGRMVVTRPFVVFGPPVDLTLATLAATEERFDAAEEHFAAARSTLKRLRGLPWLAELAYLHAALLLRRGQPGDAARAGALLDESEALAQSIGMSVLRRWIGQRKAELGTRRVSEAGSDAPVAAADAPTRATFRRSGEMWAIGFGSRVAHLRHMRGLGYLARLLAEPGRDHHVVDLAGAGGGSQAADGGDAGERLDDQARSAYRARLRDATEELAEAERANDRGRAEVLREEVELLSDELSSAFGLGGRARRAGSTRERARVAVTRAIKYAIDKIAAHDATLAEHLRASVRTGTLVSYRPSSRDPVVWEL